VEPTVPLKEGCPPFAWQGNGMKRAPCSDPTEKKVTRMRSVVQIEMLVQLQGPLRERVVTTHFIREGESNVSKRLGDLRTLSAGP